MLRPYETPVTSLFQLRVHSEVLGLRAACPCVSACPGGSSISARPGSPCSGPGCTAGGWVWVQAGGCCQARRLSARFHRQLLPLPLWLPVGTQLPRTAPGDCQALLSSLSAISYEIGSPKGCCIVLSVPVEPHSTQLWIPAAPCRACVASCPQGACLVCSGRCVSCVGLHLPSPSPTSVLGHWFLLEAGALWSPEDPFCGKLSPPSGTTHCWGRGGSRHRVGTGICSPQVPLGPGQRGRGITHQLCGDLWV